MPGSEAVQLPGIGPSGFSEHRSCGALASHSISLSASACVFKTGIHIVSKLSGC